MSRWCFDPDLSCCLEGCEVLTINACVSAKYIIDAILGNPYPLHFISSTRMPIILEHHRSYLASRHIAAAPCCQRHRDHLMLKCFYNPLGGATSLSSFLQIRTSTLDQVHGYVTTAKHRHLKLTPFNVTTLIKVYCVISKIPSLNLSDGPYKTLRTIHEYACYFI